MQRKPGDPGETTPTLPVETLRHWYVTVCGGMSPELAFDQIGINREALERNTTLDPTMDRVRVAVMGHARRPLLFDRFFKVVPLDERRPKAFARSPGGEAVFPEGDDVLRPSQAPRPGDEVILNSVVSQRLGVNLDPEGLARILQELLREDPRQETEGN